MIKKTILLLFLAAHLYSNSFSDFMQSMKQKEDFYRDHNNSLKEKAKNINLIGAIPVKKSIEKNKKIITNFKNDIPEQLSKNIPWVTKKMTNTLSDEQLKKLTIQLTNSINPKKNNLVDTVFYLFSSSQTEYSLYNFIESVSKLSKINKSIKYYGVVQGLITKDELQKIYKPFKFNNTGLKDKAIIKMQPFIFRDTGLKKAPAYLFSKCEIGHFKYKNCKNLYLVRGDITFLKALEIVSREDKRYDKYLTYLDSVKEKTND